MNDCSTKRDTYKECQIMCRETKGCKRFLYIKDTYNGRHGAPARKCCILKNGNDPVYKDLQDAVSGPAQCPGASE